MVRRGAFAVAAAVGLAVVLGILWWLGRERLASSEARVIEAVPPTGGTVVLPEPLAAAVPGLPADAPSTSRVEPSEQQDLLLTPRGTRRVLTGWLLDRRGEPLGRHILRISSSGGPGATQPVRFEVEATTERDGRFAVVGISAGTKLIAVLGPDGGDLLTARPESRHPERDPIQPFAVEGKVYLRIEPDGLRDATIVAAGHAAFWVDGALEFEPRGRHGPSGARVFLQDPRNPLGEGPKPPDKLEEIRATAIGPVVALDQDDWYSDPVYASPFVVPAYAPGDTLLVVRNYGYATLTLPVGGDAFRQHIGTVHLDCAAGLRIQVREPSLHAPLIEGEVVVREWGGSKPERTTRLELGDESSLTFWSERPSGQYELHVTSFGYEEWIGSGDLVLTPDDPPRVSVVLHRPR